MKCFYPALIGLCLLISVQGCRKNKQFDLHPILNAVNDNLLSQRPFQYAFTMLVKASLDSVLIKDLHSMIDGAYVTLDPDAKTLIFFFVGNTGQDSVVRYGSFTASLDTEFLITGACALFSFKAYLEDYHRVQGNFSIRNNGVNQDGLTEFTSLIDSALVTKDSIRNIHWSGNMVYQLTPFNSRDNPRKILITTLGAGSGVSSMGYPFQFLIMDPLKDSILCPWYHDGRIRVVLSEGDITSGSIEFMGKSECNNRIDYDFEGRLYHRWFSEKYLKE